MNAHRGQAPLPGSDRPASTAAGHWILARLGKRVLRPGGLELTRALLAGVHAEGSDVVEIAPGMGKTASLIVAERPRSYTGIDQDPRVAPIVDPVVRGLGSVRTGDARSTGLDDASADVVIGEAMLTMQGERGKRAIVSEAARILRPGGRYAIHELAIVPDDAPHEVCEEIRTALAKSIRVNARPLTVKEWSQLLSDNGFEVEMTRTAPMALLEPKRMLADEGVRGAARFVFNMLRMPQERRRVLAMRSTFRKHRENMAGVAIIARKQG